MNNSSIPREFNCGRRRFLGAAAAAVIGANFGISGSGVAESSTTPLPAWM
jgi:hypothetical protein